MGRDSWVIYSSKLPFWYVSSAQIQLLVPNFTIQSQIRNHQEKIPLLFTSCQQIYLQSCLFFFFSGFQRGLLPTGGAACLRGWRPAVGPCEASRSGAAPRGALPRPTPLGQPGGSGSAGHPLAGSFPDAAFWQRRASAAEGTAAFVSPSGLRHAGRGQGRGRGVLGLARQLPPGAQALSICKTARGTTFSSSRSTRILHTSGSTAPPAACASLNCSISSAPSTIFRRSASFCRPASSPGAPPARAPRPAPPSADGGGCVPAFLPFFKNSIPGLPWWRSG